MWKHHNSLRSARNTIETALDSALIKAELYAELVKLPRVEPHMALDCIRVVNGLIAHLEPHGCPSRAVPVPFASPPGRALVLSSDPPVTVPAAPALPGANAPEIDIPSPTGTSLSPVTTEGGARIETSNPERETRNDPAPDDADEPLSPEQIQLQQDVEDLCRHLVNRIVENGASVPPTIGAKWRDAARLLITKDKHTVTQVRAAIDWCQGNEFWRRNILSMSKLREKYERLRLDAEAERKQTERARGPVASTSVERARGFVEAGRRAQAAIEMGR